jgi:hypothetical protein
MVHSPEPDKFTSLLVACADSNMDKVIFPLVVLESKAYDHLAPDVAHIAFEE